MCYFKQMEIITKLPLKKKQRWYLLLASSLLILSLLLLATITPSSSTIHLGFIKYFHRRRHPKEAPHFVESKLESLGSKTRSLAVPRLAYLVSGSSGDVASLRRMVKALYHPRNQYVVHLDLEASAEERLELVRWVRGEKVFREVGNVRVIVRSNLVTYRGPTMVSNTLHAAAILLKEGGKWDWFINLSASDYPLVTQDDLLHTLTNIPRDLNFIEHTSDIGWKEFQRARPVIIDPGLYSPEKSDVFWVTEKRSVPTAYKLFTGSAWMMLSRAFIEYCIWGWDSLPRITLMYYSNFLSSPEGYFHTVICNSEEFRNTTVNHDLHFISWDNPPKQHPHFLTVDDYQKMVDSNAPFARKFDNSNDDVLDKIDSDILGRSSPDAFVPSRWFNSQGVTNLNTTKLKPGPGAKRLKKLITDLLSTEDFKSKHCI